MIVQLAFDHFLRDAHDDRADLRIELAEIHIGFGAGAFDDAEGTNDGDRLLLPADLEIAEASLGLCTPIAVGGNFDGAERVGLDTGLGHGGVVVPWSVAKCQGRPVGRTAFAGDL